MKSPRQQGNYRPIACLNIMYKLYTICLNQFFQDHCELNNIVTDEEAGGKKRVWGCTEQISISNVVLSEEGKQHRNFVTVWLDYKKVFDSILHSWLLKCLHLAKVPTTLIATIEKLTKTWTTIFTLTTENRMIF
ncbi:uncharacterized protein LOC106876820 [Octopus bimaculoides]|uniref:uncharacterized protein LOC106876820 n=1 Tax=Octopus bimaculoides TaxID=37653 RepID=UPI00071C391C|nr:uncharacterized protein LOC106876820 [Octopus bimaculoides]|eukprot:XP_014781021.1 PREDICTED: uncharacterized protein LOC106876820 [Octopus bimaculoides]